MILSRLKKLYYRIIRWQQRLPYIAAMHEEETTCLHCQTTFVGNYCPRCGQSAMTTKHIDFRRAFSIFLDTWGMGSNSFLRVARDLFSRPGYMIGDYLDGHRQPYLPPFKTLLVVGSLYALMILSIDAMGYYKPDDRVLGKTENVASESQKGAVRKETAKAEAEGKAQARSKEGHSQLAKSFNDGAVSDNVSEKEREHVMKSLDIFTLMMGKYSEWRENNMVQAMLLQHLLYALFAWWIFRRAPRCSGLNYSEQVIAQVYICSQIGLVSIVYSYIRVACGYTASGTLPNTLTTLLFFVNYKQLFGYGVWGTLWRTLMQEILFLLLLFIILYVAVVSIVLYGLNTI